MQWKPEPHKPEGGVCVPFQHRMWTLVNLSFFDFNFREVSLQMSFTQTWTGAMWTSQTPVTTQRLPNQGLVGSGPVRRVG